MSLEDRRVYRLQAIGSSIYVALPKDWARRLGLNKGSLVEVIVEPEGTLRIKPAEQGAKRSEGSMKTSVVIEDADTALSTLVSLYLAGFDIIELRFPEELSHHVRRAVEDARRTLLGLEVMEESSDYMVLHIFSTDEAPADVLVKNMGKLVRTMYFNVIWGLRNNDVNFLNDVELKESNLDRLYFFTVRSVRRVVLQPSTTLIPERVVKLIDLRLAARIVEEIGDYADEAAKEAIKLLGTGCDSNIIDKLYECLKHLDEVFKNSLESIVSGEWCMEAPISNLLRGAIEGSKCLSSLRDLTTNASIARLLSYYENIAEKVYDLASLISSGLPAH